MVGIVIVDNLNRGGSNSVPQHVGERRLLAADQQQREKQGEQGMQEATHEAAIRTHSPKSINLQQQALQVLAFRKRQVDRVVGGALQALHDARRAPRVECRTGDDFLEQFCAYASRA